MTDLQPKTARLIRLAIYGPTIVAIIATSIMLGSIGQWIIIPIFFVPLALLLGLHYRRETKYGLMRPTKYRYQFITLFIVTWGEVQAGSTIFKAYRHHTAIDWPGIIIECLLAAVFFVVFVGPSFLFIGPRIGPETKTPAGTPN